jgi:hypothetical protein
LMMISLLSFLMVADESFCCAKELNPEKITVVKKTIEHKCFIKYKFTS